MAAITKVFRHLDGLLADHGVEPDGVIHVGANNGAEIPVYRQCEFKLIRLVEPLPELAEVLPADCDVIEAAVAAEHGAATLYVTKWDEQSSLLPPKKLRVEREIAVDTVPLRSIQAGCNVLVVDAQGAELDVLRSGDLDNFDLLIVECSTVARYEGAATRDEVLEHLDDWTLTQEFQHRYRVISDCVFTQ